MPTIVKPGDQEFNVFKNALDSQTALNASAMAIEFTKFPMKQGECEYALSELTPTTSRINFHFKGVSKDFMMLLSQFFLSEVCGKIVTDAEKEAGTNIEAGENPIYRNNWDVEIFHVNSFMAKSKMDLIVHQLKRKFGA